MRPTLTTAASIALLLSGVARAQAWRELLPAKSPPALSRHRLVSDSRRGRLVLFRGWPAAETWEWSGGTWVMKSPTQSPSPRYGFAMAYDPARGRTVLFGGADRTGYVADTWEWDGVTWSQMKPPASPPGRTDGAMAFDPAKQGIVLFGGERFSMQGRHLGDTWKWNGSTWTEHKLTYHPIARTGHAMASDLVRRRAVLFGGTDGQSGFAGTWEWDGAAWTMSSPAVHPDVWDGHAMAFDALRDRTVLFGGRVSNVLLDSTWEWDGSAWTLAKPIVHPSARADHAMAFDHTQGRIVLYGGITASGPLADTWSYRGPGFTAYGSGCGQLTLRAVSGSAPRLGAVFRWELTPLSSSAYAALLALGSGPLLIRLDVLGMPGCSLYQSFEATLPMTLGGGMATGGVALPNQASLIGARAWTQGFVFDPGANAFGLLSSNGCELLLGR